MLCYIRLFIERILLFLSPDGLCKTPLNWCPKVQTACWKASEMRSLIAAAKEGSFGVLES